MPHRGRLLARGAASILVSHRLDQCQQPDFAGFHSRWHPPHILYNRLACTKWSTIVCARLQKYFLLSVDREALQLPPFWLSLRRPREAPVIPTIQHVNTV